MIYQGACTEGGETSMVVPVSETNAMRARASWRPARWGSWGVFRATEVLAEHAENHMPPEVAESLKLISPNPKERGS